MWKLNQIEVSWRPSWFTNIPKYSNTHWNSLENQRNFLEAIAKEYAIDKPADWRKLSITVIYKNGGKVRYESNM